MGSLMQLKSLQIKRWSWLSLVVAVGVFLCVLRKMPFTSFLLPESPTPLSWQACRTFADKQQVKHRIEPSILIFWVAISCVCVCSSRTAELLLRVSSVLMEEIDFLAIFSRLLPHANSSWARSTLSIAFMLDSYSCDHVHYHPV